MKKHELLDHSILLFHSEFSESDNLIAAANKLDAWKQAEVFDSEKKPIIDPMRSNTMIGALQLGKEWDDKLFKLFNEAILEYFSLMQQNKFNLYDEGYSVLRYKAGEEYHLHIDEINSRRVSAILFLNDNFEGGNVEFPRQKVTIKPVTGTVILFPSNYAYPHRVLPPDNTRYAVVTWFHY